MKKDLSAEIDEFREIQEEIERLMAKASNIIAKNLDLTENTLKQHAQATTAICDYMQDILCDLEEEELEQEEKELGKEISSFCQKYPKIKLSKETKEEMLSQGFSINEDLKFIVIVETPYADYSFNKKTGDDYSFNKKTGELLGKSI